MSDNTYYHCYVIIVTSYSLSLFLFLSLNSVLFCCPSFCLRLFYHDDGASSSCVDDVTVSIDDDVSPPRETWISK